jgi:hypothetical protein
MKIDVTAFTLTSSPIQLAKLSLNSSAASAKRLCALPASPNVFTTDTPAMNSTIVALIRSTPRSNRCICVPASRPSQAYTAP